MGSYWRDFLEKHHRNLTNLTRLTTPLSLIEGENSKVLKRLLRTVADGLKEFLIC